MKSILTKFFDKTFWKFIVVGIINTLFGTAIMFVFYNVFHLSYWISSASNYIFGSILSYFLNKHFTFQSRDNSINGVLRFAVNITVCLSACLWHCEAFGNSDFVRLSADAPRQYRYAGGDVSVRSLELYRAEIFRIQKR